MRRRIVQGGFGVCLASFLCGAWTPPLLLQVAPTNYKAYWNFEDAANPANANTAAFNGNRKNNGADATAADGPLRVTDVLPPGFAGIASTASMTFDGNDAITVGTPPLDLLKNDGAFTMTAWIRPASVSGTRDILRVATNDAADTRGVLALVENGKLRGGARAKDTDGQLNRTTTGAIPTGQWTHVAAVVNVGGDSVVLYVNGQAAALEAGTTAYSQGTTANTDSQGAALGSNVAGTGNRFAGHLDDLRIYERALNAAEIRSLAAPKAPAQDAPAPGPESVTVRWTSQQPGGDIGYNVYRRAAGGTGAYAKLNSTPVLGTSYTDTTTLQGADFEYVVRSVQTVPPGIESINSNAMTAAGNPPDPRVGGDNDEGLFEDKCACGASLPAPMTPAFLAGLAVLALARRRRRSL